MYTGYFVNTETGELKRTSQPKDNPKELGWMQLNEYEYSIFVKVASYAMRDYKIQTNETGFYNDTK